MQRYALALLSTCATVLQPRLRPLPIATLPICAADRQWRQWACRAQAELGRERCGAPDAPSACSYSPLEPVTCTPGLVLRLAVPLSVIIPAPSSAAVNVAVMRNDLSHLQNNVKEMKVCRVTPRAADLPRCLPVPLAAPRDVTLRLLLAPAVGSPAMTCFAAVLPAGHAGGHGGRQDAVPAGGWVCTCILCGSACVAATRRLHGRD